jgi:hypothetical protein
MRREGETAGGCLEDCCVCGGLVSEAELVPGK